MIVCQQNKDVQYKTLKYHDPYKANKEPFSTELINNATFFGSKVSSSKRKLILTTKHCFLKGKSYLIIEIVKFW